MSDLDAMFRQHRALLAGFCSHFGADEPISDSPLDLRGHYGWLVHEGAGPLGELAWADDPLTAALIEGDPGEVNRWPLVGFRGRPAYVHRAADHTLVGAVELACDDGGPGKTWMVVLSNALEATCPAARDAYLRLARADPLPGLP